jgi:hypothetical protein
MSAPALALLAALSATVIGMMLVIAGVILTGLFLVGAVLIGVGMLGFAAAAILHAVPGRAGAAA